MIPHELTLYNFMCYRGDLPPLNLDGLHIACLSGENGAGKSALLDAITWALWGKARMSDDDLISQGERDMLVDLSFALNGHRYRVVRRRQRAKSGSKSSGKGGLDLQIWQDNRWRALSENTIKETQQKIDQLLRMKYETFINASFLLQGRADEFTSKTPAERKQVLAEILDLSEYAMLEERSKKRARDLDGQIRGVDGHIEHLQSESDKLATYEQLSASAETRVQELTAELESAEAEQRTASEQLQHLQQQAARLQKVHNDVAKLRGEQERQQEHITSLHAQIDEDEKILQRHVEITAGVALLAAAQQEVARLDDLRPRYDELQEQRHHYQDQLKDELRRLQSDLDGLQREVQRLEQEAARCPELQSALAQVEQQLADLEPQVERLQLLREQQTALDDRMSRANVLLLRQKELVGQIEQRQNSLVAVREEEKRHSKHLEQQLKDLPRWRSDLEHTLNQQQAAVALSAQLAALREREQATTEHVGELRALCTQFSQQANEIKKLKELLDPSSEDATCPLCKSDLGHDGIANIRASYDEQIADLRQRYRSTKRDADAQETDLTQLREEAANLDSRLSKAQRDAARIEPLQQQIEQASAWQTGLEESRTRLSNVEQQLANEAYETEAREALLTVESELVELERITIDSQRLMDIQSSRTAGTGDVLKVVERMERQRKTIKQQQTRLERQLEQRSELERKAATHRHELEQLEAAAAALPAAQERAAALQATIERGDFGHEIRSAGRAIDSELATLGYTSEAHKSARAEVQRLMHWTDEERRLTTASSRLESNRSSLHWAVEQMEQRAADIGQCEQEAAALAAEVRDLPDAQKRVKACEQTIGTHRRNIEVAQRDLYEKQTLCKKAREAAAQLAQKQQERAALVERQDVFQELAEACGKKGVQAMLIETAIPEIEREANRLLGRITDNQMHLTFDMQRDTKKGDTVETLDIKIADAIGTRAYGAFSGGEAMRINFAIRVALSRLLAYRAGANLETLVIDEGFGALDADGRERFVDAITSVQHDFKRILVITHLQELKDRFPVHIEITKTPRGSEWALV